MIVFEHLPYFDWLRQLGEIDRLEIDNNNYIINIYEHKSRESRRTIEKGTRQLQRAYRFFSEIAPEYRINIFLRFNGE